MFAKIVLVCQKAKNFIDEKLSEEGDPKGLPFSIGVNGR